MEALLPELAGRIDLIYIDPPFGSNSDYEVLGEDGLQHAFTDRWARGLTGYLEMLAPRLERMYQLLAPHGSLYVHVDPTASHYVKVLLDGIFGPECFQREIIWRIGWVSGYKTQVRNWIRNHDVILFYTRDPAQFTFNKVLVPPPPGYQRRGGGEGRGRPAEDVWNANEAERALTGADSLDSIQIKSFSREKTGYRTQKNESLLRGVVEASSNPGDLVADFFCGSGTTAAACEALGRRWLLCDIGAPAVDVAVRRLEALQTHGAFEVLAADPPPAAQEGMDTQCSTGDWAAPASS
jgi:site-specific DNA-methyltransferase (adenine-specific)/adenine-specific DNA-methyltransferase